jgi:hypothetical protein
MSETMLIIEAREPLAFPESKPGTQFRKSLPFVPGRRALRRHRANTGAYRSVRSRPSASVAVPQRLPDA